MRRNEEIKVCCCLTYIQATSVVEITKIGIQEELREKVRLDTIKGEREKEAMELQR